MSISRALAGTGVGTLPDIDAAPPPSEPAPPTRSPVAAMMGAVGLVLAFLVVQVFSAAVVAIGTGSIQVEGDLGTRAVLLLASIQAASLVAGLALVGAGVATWRGVGLLASAREVAAGCWALAPVGLLVIVPSAGLALSQGDPLVGDGLDGIRIGAFVLLAVLISANEELWFRGLVVDLLGGRWRPWLVLLVSSVLFGLPHLGNSAAMALNTVGVTLAVGIPFAAVRLRHVALLPLIIWHAAIDTWAFLHTASVVAEGDPSLSDAATGLVVPLVLAIAYALWLRRSLPLEAAPAG